jgi:hypothetical protein
LKDIILRGAVVRRELAIWVIFFVGAFGLNLYAISVYDSKWSELFSQLHIVVLLSVAFYIITALFRGFYFILKYLISRKGKK